MICKEQEGKLDIWLPESRSFYMGAMNDPYSTTPQTLEKTYSIIVEHADLIAHHIQGVPWPEAFEDRPYHPIVEKDINSRLNHLQEDQRVYLALTPISLLRNSLALDHYEYYWGGEIKDTVWIKKDFDDSDVIKAYINYCRRMIHMFRPDFMAYGIEVNVLAAANPVGFEKYLVMTKQVYETLKRENPELPIFLTFHNEVFQEHEQKQREVIERLLPYTDYIAVSTYPFVYKADPNELPEDWFSKIAGIAPEKPFAVAETGFPAEDVIIKDSKIRNLDIHGTARWQAEYIQFLFNKSNELDAKFIAWFFPVDYDLWWREMGNSWDDFFKFCRDCGLIDERMEPRPSLEVWDTWLELPIKEEAP